MRSTCFFLLTLVFSLNTNLGIAADKVYIEVGQANVEKSRIAMPPYHFFGSSALKAEWLRTANALFSTVKHDLDVSAYFQFINESAYLEDTKKTSLKPNSVDKKNGFSFSSWQTLQTKFLIRGGFDIKGDELVFEAYLYKVPYAEDIKAKRNTLIFGKKYNGKISAHRKIAHTFSNDVVKALTGRDGIFNTKIVVSSNRAGGRNKEIFRMDWDAHNVKQLTNHKTISISPAMSDDGRYVAYTVYAYHPKAKTRNIDLFLYDMKLGKRKLLSAKKGINSGAAFIPGREQLLMTISKNSNPDIYLMNYNGSILQRLTHGPLNSMNVEPAISPDLKTVAFSSDRAGKPMIYVMPFQKQRGRPRTAKRIVYAGWYNSTPSWSPDSKRIAFAGFDKDLKHFDIFSMNADGTDLIRLTTAKKLKGNKYSNNEDPTYSPDGRHVMFISDRTGRKQIYMVNADGTDERRLTNDSFDYFKPKWSKYSGD